MVRLGQKIATLVFDGGAIRFKHDFGTSGSELLSEALHYFCCRDIFERVALGRRPMSENASKVLQQKSGGQETLPRRLSDNRIMFEWCCSPVSRADVEEVIEEGRRARRRSACVAPDLGGGGKAP